MKQHVALALILIYLWALMIFLGGILCVTFILYPNIFHDVPRSLETTMAFAVVRGPSDFFAPVGMLAMLTGIGFLILGWRVKSARCWILGSLLVFVLGEMVFSMAYFWSRNTIMFVEGSKIHSVAYLKQTAHEFQTGHWLRLAMSACAATLSFIGFLEFYRHRITSRNAERATSAPVGA
jgi:hypothetical protein